MALGGLRSAIFNEVLQFVLIWLGALLIPILGPDRGRRLERICKRRSRATSAPPDYTHLWSTLGSFTDNPMGIHWTGIVLGLGWVISFGYWTTDFLVVQRVLAAKDLRSAKMAPIIGAAFKMMVPFIVILPGLLGLGVLPDEAGGRRAQAVGHRRPQLQRSAAADAGALLRPGPAGAGHHGADRRLHVGHGRQRQRVRHRVDLRHLPRLHAKDASDAHYVSMGRWCTIVGVFVSIGTAYLVMQFTSIMDYVQALFSFFIAPLFGTVLLGMLWKRATPAGGFWGLLAGTVSSIAHVGLGEGRPRRARHRGAFARTPSPWPRTCTAALWSWIICVVVTVVVSYDDPAASPRASWSGWSTAAPKSRRKGI